jgi:hypothetical protein
MKPGYHYARIQSYGTTTLFATPNLLDSTVIGRNMKRHCHQEFIRFLNTIEAQVPERKAIHAIVDNYALPQHPKGARMACSASALDFSLHPDFRILAQCGRRLFSLNLTRRLSSETKCNTPADLISAG